MMNFWMRWVNFRSLRDILLLVKANPAKLRAKDLTRLATDEGILLGKDGQPLGPTTHYHHRRTLERLGLLVKHEGRYRLNDELPETNALTAPIVFREELDDEQKKAFANVILRNDDCRTIFFKGMLGSTENVNDVGEFMAQAQPIELKVVQGLSGSPGRGRQIATEPLDDGVQGGYVATRPSESQDWTMLFGTNAIQAIHFGIRAWCVEQLNFLDEVFHAGGVYTVFPRHVTPYLSPDELNIIMVESLGFDGEWATVRVGDFALACGIKLRLSIGETKGVLASWMERHPDLVAAIPTNERFITGGSAVSQREAILKGFLRGPSGAYVSHLRIHRDIQCRIRMEVQVS